MITNRTRVTFENGTTIEVDKGTSLYELSMKYQPEMKHKIVGAEINNEVVPLDYRINKESTVMFLDSTYINGYFTSFMNFMRIIDLTFSTFVWILPSSMSPVRDV